MNLFAQDSIKTNGEPQQGFLDRNKHWSVELPLWIPGYYGHYIYGDNEWEGGDGSDPGDPGTPVHPIEPPDYSEILTGLFNSDKFFKYFWGLRVTYEHKRLLAQVDVKVGVVGNSVKYALNNEELLNGDFKVSLIRFFVGYSFIEWENRTKKHRLNFYACLGLNFHSASYTTLKGNDLTSLSLNFDWMPPLVGLQFRYTTTDWLLLLHGDYGASFGGESYTYMIQFLAHFRLSGLLSVKLGWQEWEVYHDTNEFNERFIMNVILTGPTIGMLFHF